MRGRTTIKVSGSLRGLLLSSFVLLTGIASTIDSDALAQDAAASCAPAVGRVVSLQGNVEVRRAGTANWLKVSQLDTSICTGDRLRTSALSRAALFVQPETIVRVDENTTISLSQTTAEILVEFHTDEVSQSAQNAQSCGAGYFITRFPRKFKVSTPHMNAAVEGTEFMVESSCKSSALTVLEGQVLSQSATTKETRSLTAGERLETGPASGSAFSAVVKPADAVQWVLRYPPISDARAETHTPSAEECRALPAPSRSGCLTRRAELLIRLGRGDVALADIDAALRDDPANGEANALRAIIQIAKNDNSSATESANKATLSDPDNYRAWLALSYAQQATFELEQALDSALRARALQTNSSLVHSRVAELLLSLGFGREAEASARAAVNSDAGESAAHTILGFVHLAQIDIEAARADFNAAIERDSFSAMPRLGLGLAMIRDGELVEGREQLEIAVALDPTNSLLRSYVGKAYFEENQKKRDDLAGKQFALAKQLDAKHPTPWFYAAILDQSQNRPVEALNQLNSSKERNNNRAVYRSENLLGDDSAALNASVAGIYGSLGFEKLAILESTKALADNAGNHSAHRQLASAYANLPRHDIARVSEALQAQIRQPVTMSPVSPLLSTDNLLILRDTGPSQPGAYEFNQLFNRKGVEFTVDAVVGSRDTLGNQVVVSGLVDRFSFSASELHYETDGFIDNDSAEKTVYDAFIQGQLSTASSMQADLKRSESEVGQTFFPFDPSFAEQDTILETSNAFRLSGHYVVDPGTDWIWSTMYEDRQRSVRIVPDNFVFSKLNASTVVAELQNLRRFKQLQIISGVGYVEEVDDFRLDQIETVIKTTNVYAYGQWRSRKYDLSIQAGFTGDWFELKNSIFTKPIERNHLSPKVGLVWSPRTGTTLRAAAFSTVRRPFIGSQTIEPTQVAGFNQFFTGLEQFFGDRDGTISERIGIAIDQVLSRTVSTGVELAKRRLDVPSLVAERDFTWHETTAHFYLYKSIAPDSLPGFLSDGQAALSMEGEYEKLERPQILTGAEGIMDLRTIRAPIAIRFFSNSGMSVRFAVTYVEQEGTFSADVGFPTFPKEDSAWVADFAIEYRLPRRLGSVELGAHNLLDNFVDLLETDPFKPRVATRQFLFAKFRLNF